MSALAWRRSISGLVGLCVWTTLLVSGLPAQEPPPAGGNDSKAATASIEDYTTGSSQASNENRDYIWLDVKDKDLHELLASISRRVDVNIIADPEIKEKVTIQLDRVEWRYALDVIARDTNCKIVEVGDRLIRFTQPPAISMEFQDADIKVVLDLLAKQSGANIITAPDVQSKVTMSLREVPWRDALDTIVRTAGYITVRTELGGGGEILRVVRPESLKDQLETRSFTLRYIRPADPYKARIDGVEKVAVESGGGVQTTAAAYERGGGAKSGGDGGAEAFSLETALREALSKEGTLQYDTNTNTFIIKDTKPKLDEIANIIRLVDVKPSQVYVEVKFIRTTNSDLLERGVKFDLPGTPERDGFQVIARGGEPDSTSTDPLLRFGGSFPFDIGRVDRIPKDFQALGILDFTQTRLVLSMIKDDENSRIVQEPMLTMLDNKPGTIFVGETVPFAVQRVQADQNGNLTVSIDENKRSPINIGFTLYLIPHVIPGTDQVDLTVIPKVSALSGTTSDIEGFERFQFTDESSATQAFIDLPREASQSVVTSLRVQDGHTAVIGGLQTEKLTEIESKIPLLSSIPILGNLFTWKRKKNNVDSLLIMITPRIIKNVGDQDLIRTRSESRHQERDFFYQKYEKKDSGEKAAAGATEAAPGADTLVR